MNSGEHTVRVTEKILGTRDLTDKISILRKHTRNIADYDKELFKLMDEVIIDKQKGEIVDALDEKKQNLKIHNQNLLEEVDQQINKMVTQLDEQVEDIKTQELIITYQDLLSLI